MPDTVRNTLRSSGETAAADAAPGWTRIACAPGVPTLLLDAGDERLYGVFVDDAGRAAIHELDPDDGARGWQGRPVGEVAPGFESSAGVVLDGRIWLVGGSQIDPARCSNRVWRLDPATGEQDSFEMPGPALMGHACAVFDDRVWVVGGVDADGNALDAVLAIDGAGRAAPAPALPEAVCMATALAFQGRLWVYGGLDAPFGTPRARLWGLDPETGRWTPGRFERPAPQPPADDAGIGEPLASALFVRRAARGPVLGLVGTFRRDATVGDAIYDLTGLAAPAVGVETLAPAPTQATGWLRKRAASDAQGPYRLSALGFGPRVFVVSLVYGAASRTLSCLVP